MSFSRRREPDVEIMGNVKGCEGYLAKSTKKCKCNNVLTIINEWGGVKCELLFNFASDCRLISLITDRSNYNFNEIECGLLPKSVLHSTSFVSG